MKELEKRLKDIIDCVADKKISKTSSIKAILYLFGKDSIPSDGWIDVKERLPNDSKFYSIAFETTDQVRRGCYDRLEMKWIDEDGEEYYGVTHYKLPEPPKRKE